MAALARVPARPPGTELQNLHGNGSRADARGRTTKSERSPRGAEAKHLLDVDLPWWDDIRRRLEDRYDTEYLDELRLQYLSTLDSWMPRDIIQNVDTALLVKVSHTNCCGCILLSLLTLGLYACFRPWSDLGLLILTKDKRVILLKRLPHSLLGFDPGQGIWVVLLYLVALIGVTVLPVFVGCFLTRYLGMDWHDWVRLLDADLAQRAEEAVEQRVKVYYCIVFAFWLAFIVWIWTHRQRGYGVKIHREFRARSISAAQYVLENGCALPNCCLFRKCSARLRLFFGRYPAEEELDDIPFQIPHAHAARPFDYDADGEEDRYDTGSGSGFGSSGTEQGGGTQNRSGMEKKVASYFPALSFLLFIATVVNQGLQLYGYYEEYQKASKKNGFCKSALLESECTEPECRLWAANASIDNVAFCGYVKWINGTRNGQALQRMGVNISAVAAVSSKEALCSVLRAGMDACCSGCIHGHIFEFLGGDDVQKWFTHATDASGIVLLCLALLMSKMAMAYKYSLRKDANSLDIDFLQDINQRESADFLVKEELAVRLLKHVFVSAEMHEADTTVRGRAIGRSSQGDNVPVREEYTDRNWSDFFRQKRLVTYEAVTHGLQEVKEYLVPRRLLGMPKHERVIEVWTEEPFLTARELVYWLLASFLLVGILTYWPHEYGGPRIFGRCGVNYCTTTVLVCKAVRNTKAFWCSILLWLICVLLRYVLAYSRQQSIVVVTEERIFAIYHRPHWLSLLCCRWCELPFNLRVEVFRHGDTTFYGRMSSSVPPWHIRMFSWTPWSGGEVTLKCKFGVLQLSRHSGEVTPIWELVSTILAKQVDDYEFEKYALQGELKLEKVPVWYGVQEEQKEEDEAGTIRKLPTPTTSVENYPWQIAPREDDPYDRKEVRWTAEVDPEDAEKIAERCFVLAPQTEEKLVYIWSFKEAGLMADPFNRFNDVVVTTDRIRFHSASDYRAFDCRTWLCWGFCWCACIRRCCGMLYKPEVRAFLNLSHLEAFSTETSLMPAFCLLNCPCYNAFCGMLTSCVCCRWQGMKDSFKECWELPGTTEPLSQLWLKWMPRYAKSSQSDMVLSQRPCELLKREDEEEEKNASSNRRFEPMMQDPEVGCCQRCYPLLMTRKDVPQVRDLRELMHFVLSREEDILAREVDRLGPWVETLPES